MTYKVEWSKPAKRAIAERLPLEIGRAVRELVMGAIAENSHRVGKELRPPLDGIRSVRRGENRVLYRIDEQARTIMITDIDHRRTIYR